MKLVYHSPQRFLFVDFFVNPLPAAAMVMMALNDHWWKQTFHSWLTGKISDFMGVFYFPIFLCALVCLARNFLLRPFSKSPTIAYITPRMMAFGMAVTAFLMIAIKTSPQAASEVQSSFSRFFFPFSWWRIQAI